MPSITFNGVVVVGVVAVLVPLLLALVPRLRLPTPVAEFIAGILIGPAVLGWVHPSADSALTVLSDLGLGYLLFMAGFEINAGRLRGRSTRLALIGFGCSVVLGVLAATAFRLGGANVPIGLLAIVLMSTSAGLLLPVLKEMGEEATPFGQLMMTSGSLAEIGPILLLSLLFSTTVSSDIARVLQLGYFLGLVGAIAVSLAGIRRLGRVDRLLAQLEARYSQLRVRIALTITLAFGVLAYRFGFEAILGAFAAGLLVSSIHLAGSGESPLLPTKLEAIGFGFLIPIFFITAGAEFDLHALTSRPGAIAAVPLFLLGFLLVRGLPAALYRNNIGPRRSSVAGLLQATTLTIVIVAVRIGLSLGQIGPATGAALLASGLLSSTLFPAAAVWLFYRTGRATQAAGPDSGGAATPDDAG